ncbi:MAG: M23 family metallopeptidase [Campylobacterota bacterium]|nr:M23 family metallopeptidase [Campylobacterota bacterium]
MRFLLLFLLFFSSLIGLEVSISDSTISNGRTIYIEFEKKRNVNYQKIIFDKKNYTIFTHPNDDKKMYAFLPLSYYQKPNYQEVKIVYQEGTQKKEQFISIEIKDGNYKKEKIVVQKSKVNPTSKKVKKRTAKEYKEAMDIYSTITEKSYISSEFIVPINSKITSDFGKARVYNNTLNGYHSGTDFRAKIGTPIKASNDGVVILAKDRFYAGNSIIIDHGQGVYSCYYHLSKFNVISGDKVYKSQIIGLSGDTGRITGPHLHFSMRVGGIQVDPLQFIKLINNNLFKKV